MHEITLRLEDPDPTVRQMALARLIQEPRPDAVAPLTERLEDPDPDVRHLAVVALAGIGTPALGALQSALSPDQPAAVRAMAANGLARLNVDAAPATAALEACLTDEDDALRWHASFALARIGEAALPHISAALESGDARTRVAAADAIRWIGEPAQSLAPKLESMLERSEWPESMHVSAAHVAASGDPSVGLPLLVAAAGRENSDNRQAAIEMIGQIGPPARSATPTLLEQLADECPDVRAAATLALARIKANDPAEINAIARLLDDPQALVRRHSVIALSSFGSDASTAQEALRARLEDADPSVRAAAKAAVEAM